MTVKLRATITLVMTAAFHLGCAHESLRDAWTLAEGETIPSVLAVEPRPVTVAWILREADCISCLTPATPLRSLRRFGDTVDVLVVMIGSDSTVVRSFLREERIPARIQILNEATFRETMGRTRLPALVVVSAGKVAKLIEPPKKGQKKLAFNSTTPLDETVASLLAAVGRTTLR